MTDNTETAELVKFEQKIDLRLNELRQENRCCDVRFEIDGKIFPCHRLVLIAASPYFDAMFNGNFKESSSDTIYLKDVEVEIFEEILNAIYTASFHLLPSNAYSFLKASHLLLLDAVENACVDYIRKNINRVHYLVEIYLFSKNIQPVLHTECSVLIAEDLFNYGRTDSFTQITIDSFGEILSQWHPKSYEEEFTFQLISKWSKEHKTSCENVQKLFVASGLEISKLLNPALIAQYIISSDDTCVDFETKNQNCTKMELDVNFDLNVYLNVIDVKTGQRGWGVLKINEKFDTYILSSFHPSNSLRKIICKVGSMIYCFEYFDGENERNSFFCYNENSEENIPLPTPEKLMLYFYQMKSVGTSIYLTAVYQECFIVYIYDCDSRIWKEVEITEMQNNPISACTLSNGRTYLIVHNKSDNTFVLQYFDCNSWVVQRVTDWELEPEDPEYIICGVFGDSVAVCIVYPDGHHIDFFDSSSREWMYGCNVMKLNFNREKFCVFSHKGFVYALENNRSIKNEQFNVETKTWEDLPALPKRVTCNNVNAVRELATGSVLGADSEATKN